MSITRKAHRLGFVAGLLTGSTSATAAVLNLFPAAQSVKAAAPAALVTPLVYWIAAIGTMLLYIAWLQRYGQKVQSSARDADTMAHLDELTSLQNRRAMLAHIAQMQAAGQDGLCGALVIDLDRFKAINDRFGHAAGDTVLKTVSMRIKRLCGRDEHPYRMGGDEFAVLIDKLGSVDALLRLTRDLSCAIAKPIMIEGQPVVVECSIGQAVGSAKLGVDGLIRAADQNMYQHKQTHHDMEDKLWTSTPGRQLALVAGRTE